MKTTDKISKTIQIEWFFRTDKGIDIPEKHIEALEEDAESRIYDMIKEGYYQGELSTTVRFGKDEVPEEDEDDGLSYSGWFSVVRK